MAITGRQIRGARGLLGWSMEDLAAKADLTRITIRQIEGETVQPQERTLNKLFSLFDKHGIEFLPEEGIKIRKQETRTYSGKAGYRQLLDHVYETLKDGGVLRQFNYGDNRYAPYEEAFVAEHISRMTEIEDLDAKVLEPSVEAQKQVNYCDYRILEKKFTGMAPWYLYHDFLVLSLNEAGGKREFVTVHSKLLAERYLREFDIFWNLSAPIKRKKKDK
jgi:transcriptional regulator with XRE-family HTH domain